MSNAAVFWRLALRLARVRFTSAQHLSEELQAGLLDKSPWELFQPIQINNHTLGSPIQYVQEFDAPSLPYVTPPSNLSNQNILPSTRTTDPPWIDLVPPDQLPVIEGIGNQILPTIIRDPIPPAVDGGPPAPPFVDSEPQAECCDGMTEPPDDGTGPQPVIVPVGGGGGGGGGAGGDASNNSAVAILLSDCHRGSGFVSAASLFGLLTLNTSTFAGYAFAGEPVVAHRVNGVWLATGCGHNHVSVRLGGQLGIGPGKSTIADVAGTPHSVEVFGDYLDYPLPQGHDAEATWYMNVQRWVCTAPASIIFVGKIGSDLDRGGSVTVALTDADGSPLGESFEVEEIEQLAGDVTVTENSIITGARCGSHRIIVSVDCDALEEVEEE